MTVRARLGGAANLAMLFASPHHADQLGSAAAVVSSALETENLLGCTGEAIIGGAREVERGPALSLWAAQLSATRLWPMHLKFVQMAEGATFVGWPADLPEPWPNGSALLLLGDPFSFAADELVRRLNEDRPGVPVLGGMASGGTAPGETRLVLGKQVVDHGAVAVLVHGAIQIRSVVSQGCRPVGRRFVVTKADANVILELAGQPPLQRLEEIYHELDARDQELIRHGLHLGRVLSEYQQEFRRGDFLVRNVIGADPRSGAIAVGDYVRAGQTVQFHVRDAETADEDLRELLREAASREASPAAGLLFTCNGRGTRMFAVPDHDARCLREVLGDIPVAGFFAQGELGPVGGQNCLHGFTASIALFAPVSES